MLNELKRKGKESRSLSLPSLYYSLFAKDFDPHDALGDCKALSEVLLAAIPGENFVKYGNLLTVEEVKNDISKRSVIRRTVISFQDLPDSKGIKEKLAKAGTGLSSIRGHVGAQKARVNGVYGVNDEIVITSKLVKSIWFFCSVSNFALSKVNFIELVSKT